MISAINFTAKNHKIRGKEFYNKHPDLAPRNVYLAMGRVINQKDVNRKIENFGEPLMVRAKNWIKYKIEDMFSKK